MGNSSLHGALSRLPPHPIHALAARMDLAVGGFLGMGEHEVAVNFDSIRMSRDQKNNLVVTMNATKDVLKDAPQGAGKPRRSSNPA